MATCPHCGATADRINVATDVARYTIPDNRRYTRAGGFPTVHQQFGISCNVLVAQREARAAGQVPCVCDIHMEAALKRCGIPNQRIARLPDSEIVQLPLPGVRPGTHSQNQDLWMPENLYTALHILFPDPRLARSDQSERPHTATSWAEQAIQLRVIWIMRAQGASGEEIDAAEVMIAIGERPL